MKDWHNFRLTRKLPDGNMEVTGDYERSIKDKVEDDVFHSRGVFDLFKVEFSGEAGGPHFFDVTNRYKDLFHAMTHESPEQLKRR